MDFNVYIDTIRKLFGIKKRNPIKQLLKELGIEIISDRREEKYYFLLK
jgi:hypothetical protein